MSAINPTNSADLPCMDCMSSGKVGTGNWARQDLSDTANDVIGRVIVEGEHAEA